MTPNPSLHYYILKVHTFNRFVSLCQKKGTFSNEKKFDKTPGNDIITEILLFLFFFLSFTI